MENNSITKRELLRKSGTALAGLSAVGTASARRRAGDDGRQSQDENNRTQSENETESDSVKAQSVASADATFGSWKISTSEETTFDCSWDVFLPFGFSAHRLDAHIEAEHIEQPEINAVDVGRGAIKREWEYEPDPSHSGMDNPTYHFKIQKQFVGLPGTTQNVGLNSEIVPTSSGDVSAWVGGQFGGGNVQNGFVGAELEIE